MRRFFCVLVVALVLLAASAASANSARFGYFWKDQSLPYDREFSYTFDISVYPDGVFSDSRPHGFAYVTSQNKHILYNGTPYSVEAVMQYGYNTTNASSIKRVWVSGLTDQTRFKSWWVDSDANGKDYWDMSSLVTNGYIVQDRDSGGGLLNFMSLRIRTVLLSEAATPPQTTWQNEIYFLNLKTGVWRLKAKNQFVIAASSQQVRASTYAAGSGIWSSILETADDNSGPPDYGPPPVRKIVVKNRYIQVVDGYRRYTASLDDTNQIWVQPNRYRLFFRSAPQRDQFEAGT